MKTLKIGIVGGGGMGRVHYANWKAIEGIEIVALCDNAPNAPATAEEITTNGAHESPLAIARPIQAPTSGDFADNASAMKLRKSSPGILAICPIISPKIREQNRPNAI